MNDQDLLKSFQKASKKSALVSGLAAFIILGALLFSSYRLYDLRRAIERENSELSDLRSEKEGLIREIDEKKKELSDIKPLAIRGLGYREGSNEIAEVQMDESLKANTEIQKFAPIGKEQRVNIVIQYYPRHIEKEVNQTIVLPALERLGFQLKQMPSSKIPTETNSIWHGTGVRVDDVKLVALTLIAAGVSIRAIREFRNPEGPKRELIEVGTDRAQAAAPKWTTERVVLVKNFERER